MDCAKILSPYQYTKLDFCTAVETGRRYHRLFRSGIRIRYQIVRFPGIRDGANPHDEEWQLYLEERETEKMRITVKGNHTLRYLFNKQRGCCALCGEKLTLETGGRCHKYKHGSASLNFLVHPDCHRKLHQFPSFQPAYCGSNRL